MSLTVSKVLKYYSSSICISSYQAKPSNLPKRENLTENFDDEKIAKRNEKRFNTQAGKINPFNIHHLNYKGPKGRFLE